MTKPPNLADLEADIERLSVEKDEAVKSADYERAAELRDKAEQLRRQKEQIQFEGRSALGLVRARVSGCLSSLAERNGRSGKSGSRIR
jgi:ATP-dependent Clp protease ATP-binding subunit ClpA